MQSAQTNPEPAGVYQPSWKERFRVWRTNWPHRKTGSAYKTLVKAMKDDPEYAWSWYCNISMPIFDQSYGKLSSAEADLIASTLMKHLFDVTIIPK